MNKALLFTLYMIGFIILIGLSVRVIADSVMLSTASSDLIDYINTKLGVDLGAGKTVTSLGITNSSDVKKYLYKWGNHIVIEWKDSKMKTNITSIVKASDISQIDKSLTQKDFDNLPTWWRINTKPAPKGVEEGI